MSLRRCSLLFFLLAVVAGAVRFAVDTPRTEFLIDATFVTAVVCFLTCGIGDLGRRLAKLAREHDARRSDARGSDARK